MQLNNKNTRLVVKRYNDKLSFVRYKLPQKHYIPCPTNEERQKIDLETGEVSFWNWDDAKRKVASCESSMRRCRKNIKELSDKNRFNYFLTITFNQRYVNRNSAESAQKTFKNVLKRLKYHFKGVAYLAVPEFHHDGENIHYHLLISFAKEPRLIYKGKSKQLHNIYHISHLEKFKRSDCFLVLEKITDTQPVHYLIKYITKEYDQPLKRRFSASRGLNRSKLQEKFSLSIKHFSTAQELVENIGFIKDFENYKTTSLIYDTTRASAWDLSIKDTKDENLKLVFYKLVTALYENYIFSRESEEIRKKYKNLGYGQNIQTTFAI